MGIEENKDIGRKLIEVFDEEYFQQVRQADNQEAEIAKIIRAHRSKYISLDGIIHTPRGDSNFEENLQNQISLCTAIPDLSYKAEDIIADDNKVMVRYSGSGTFLKPFGNIPANGKKVNTHGVWIGRIVDGKMVESWVFHDTLGFLQQLGAIPTK
jgi:predicted ester cyclase